ncbi:MAG: citramalate synthase [Spirochaetales bacterium]|nr:citramalate synthase [Spirochaetales bacterium]
MKKIDIFDTTLRDGMQGLEINFTLDDKLEIARKLDEFKIDYIEGGFPLSNDLEAEFFRRIRREKLSHAKIVAFGSTRKPKGKAESDPQITALIEAETPAVVVVGKAWTAHVDLVLKTTREENLNMIRDSISVLKKEGREVIFDLEHFFDGYKADPAYAVDVLKAGKEAGADCLVLCDTNGGMLPMEVAEIVRSLPRQELARIGIHCHNDTGNAVANTLVAVAEGAVHVQGTINGWGERCGNANLCVVLPNLCLKMKLNASPAANLDRLTSLSRFVAEKANIIPDRRSPYVGEAAFTHKSGQHVDVLMKADYLMEHVPSASVGNERSIILSILGSRSTILKKLAKYGEFDKNEAVVHELANKMKTLEQEGYEYEAAEASFDLIIRKALGRYKPLFELLNYNLESHKVSTAPAKTVGKIFLRLNEQDVMGAAVRTGPVDALDAALRDALAPAFPFIAKLKITDYRVRVLNPEKASSAKVRVFVTSSDGDVEWDTVGVSENIIEASWQALVDSFEYYYDNHVLDGTEK